MGGRIGQAARDPPPPKPPISRIQLAVFLAYEGNGDLYIIRNTPDPDMFDGAWGTINSLLQQMGLWLMASKRK
jgi:hypothetical protein